MNLFKFKFDYISFLFINLQWLSSVFRIMALSLLIGSLHLLPLPPHLLSCISPELHPPQESPGPLEGYPLSQPWAVACAISLFLDILSASLAAFHSLSFS